MKFDTPATTNPIDQLKVIGKPTDRIDGPLKTTGTAPYAYERHDVVKNPAYGYVIGSAIAKGRITAMDLSAAKAAPGVLAIVTAETVGKLDKGKYNTGYVRRRFRRHVRGRSGAVGCDLHHARRVACNDGAACLDGRLGRRQAHALDIQSDDQLEPRGRSEDARHPK
jgi:hypothetical protein